MPRSLHNEKKKIKKNWFYLVEFQRLIKNVNGLCDRQGHFLFQLRIHIQIRIRIQKRKQSRPKMANHAKRYAAQPWSWEHAMAGVLRRGDRAQGDHHGETTTN